MQAHTAPGHWRLTAEQTQALDAYLLAGSIGRTAERIGADVIEVDRLLEAARQAMGAPHLVAAVVEWTVYRAIDWI